MPVMSSAYVRGYVLNAMKQAEVMVRKDLEATTRTWNHPVTFRTRIRYAGGNARVLFSTDDRAWNVLNKGSGPRWALMSKGYVAKTSPGWIGSRSGKGRAVIVGQEAMQKAGHGAQPPIEARNWPAAIVERRRQQIRQLISSAVARGVRAGIK